jgi:mono/diheme cytochrome c family protein
MRQLNKWLRIVGAPTLIAGCAVANEPTTGKTATSEEPLVITAGTRLAAEGIIDFGGTIFAENPTTRMEGSDFHAYEFSGRAGGNVTITMTGQTCGIPDTVLHLFGPADAAGNRGANLAENDDAILPCAFDSQIRNFTLPVSGKYLIVATSFLQQGGNRGYRLSLTCNNAACALSGALTFTSSKVAQTSIDSGLVSADTLFNIGDFLFEYNFQVQEGLGNALTGLPANNQPRPNFRAFPAVHFAAFGAPEAQSCGSCHNIGGEDGAGDQNHNIFQAGDGITTASGLQRNPPPLLGSGFRQAIAAEMTAELQAQLAAGKTTAKNTNTNVTVTLNAKTRGFGSVVARPDGTVDFTNLSKAVDSDLVVKPFGWKGREATIRRFIEGGFRVHFGMQTEPSVNKHCITPNTNTFGTGANCQDPDADGVVKEISDGQLSATSVYLGLLGTPVRLPAVNSAAQTRVNQGEVLFNQVNCQACHTQNMTINSPFITEKGDTTTGAGIRLNLGTQARLPRPAVAANGSVTAEIWSDFRRHDMGAVDTDSKPFNQIGASFFMTPPLWGIRDTGPFLHDGRAKTLLDSILLHGGGDDTNSINAFKALSADDQLKIQEFMNSLGRQEDKDAAGVKVDLSNFIIEQTGSLIDAFTPAGTLVSHGGTLVVARNASRAQFETFYGKVLPADAVFLTGAGTFPIIDGGETFALFDLQGVFIDGRSIAEPTGALRTFQRTSCNDAAPLAASWKNLATSTAVATPGVVGQLNTGLVRICISEVADATNANFEYVEIFVE